MALTIAAGYGTVFLSGMCLRPFLRHPRQNFDSGVALILHLLLLATAWKLGGVQVMVFAIVLPLAIASAVGSYIFYVQHNFPEVEIRGRHEWTYAASALHSSAYIEMGPVARWFLGNIGFHHVHHLNPRIPFYRLPEAMQEIPELRDPPRTTLGWRDVVTSFRLKLWDPERNVLQMVAGSFGAPGAVTASYQVNPGDLRSNAARVFELQRPYLTNHAHGDPAVLQDYAEAFAIERLLSVPLSVGDRAIGVLHVSNKPTEFGLRDIEELERLAPRIAVAAPPAAVMVSTTSLARASLPA